MSRVAQAVVMRRQPPPSRVSSEGGAGGGIVVDESCPRASTRHALGGGQGYGESGVDRCCVLTLNGEDLAELAADRGLALREGEGRNECWASVVVVFSPSTGRSMYSRVGQENATPLSAPQYATSTRVRVSTRGRR